MPKNTIANLLSPASQNDNAIIIPNGPTTSYAQYADEIERTAGLLAAAGVKPERPVSIALVNNLEFMVLFLAVARAGAHRPAPATSFAHLSSSDLHSISCKGRGERGRRAGS